MRALWKLFSGIALIGLAFWFLTWYVKGHFGKYFIFFWLWTIFTILNYVHYHNSKPKEDPTPGYVYWERNVKSW